MVISYEMTTRVRSSISFQDLASITYTIIVYTGDVFGSGTNANVSIVLYGENGDTGERALTQSFRDLFERNQVDKFEITAVDLGKKLQYCSCIDAIFGYCLYINA